MRQISLAEVHTVSGGMHCFDGAFVMKVRAKAMKDAANVATVTTILSGTAAAAVVSWAGAGTLVSAAAGTAVGVAAWPWIAGYVFFNSSEWKLLGD